MSEKTNTSPARVAIYARFGTKQFNPGHLEKQERRCREYIAEQLQGCVVADDRVFRERGISRFPGQSPASGETR